MSDSTTDETAPEWPLWHRLVVRYLTLHFVLYAFPAPLAALPKALFGAWQRLLPEGQYLPGFAMRARAAWNEWAELPRQGWEAALTWLQDCGLTFGAEMIHTATIRSDTGAAWTRVAYVGILAVLLTAIWSVIDRRRTGHPVLGRWLHLGARWFLALHMLEYAWPKLFGHQFQDATVAVLTREVGDLVPSSVAWTFMGHSPTYEFLGGLGELLGFALLLHRRTALLGACITAAVMANVCALNWLYDVPLKQFSTHLFLISLLLLLPYRHRLWALFISHGNAAPVDLRVTKSAWLGWPLLIVGCLWAAAACANGAFANYATHERLQSGQRSKPELFGLWQVERQQRDGESVPVSDPARWRDVAIDRGNTLRIRARSGRVWSFEYAEDLEAAIVTLTPRGPDREPLVWQFERSTVTRKGFHPAPRQPEDFRTMVDVERQALTFRGQWQGSPIEVFVVQKVFAKDRPFRLITEWPK